MILQKDAAVAIAEVGPVLVFAVGHKRVPLLCVTLILQHLHAIEPMLHMIALHDNGGCVPSSDIKGLLLRSRDKVVEGSQLAVTLHAQLGIGVTQVVKYLELATNSTTLALVHVGVNEILDAAVGTFGNLEIDLQDEVVVGLVGHDVAAVAALGTISGFHLEHAVLDAPTLCGEGLQLGSAPAVCGLTIPKKPPTLALFLLCEYIICCRNRSRFCHYFLVLC